jgi:hypothetical protein
VSDQSNSFTDLGRNILSKSESGKRIVISEQVENLKAKGFTADETFDILASKDYNSVNLIEEIVNNSFSRISSNRKKIVKEAFVVPTNYNELKDNINQKLNELGPLNFVNLLARSENPIMPVNDKAYNSYLRMAKAAYEDPNSLPNLHASLGKWFEEAMYVSVCAAKSNKNDIKVASVNNKFIATNSKNASYEVSLENGTCTCSKFTKSHYGDFGLACEHIVSAAEKVSPHQRLLKAVREASELSENENKNLYCFDMRAIMRS